MPAAPRAATARVLIVTPYLAAANNGNWQTAARWARMLRERFRVRIATDWTDGDPVPDVLIALHARRSAAAIDAFGRSHPTRPCILVLTGTDLYRDIRSDRQAQRSLHLAHRLVVLNALGARSLPPAQRSRATVVVQSAEPLPGVRKTRGFTVAVVGHLRDEKNPQLVWRMLDGWPQQLPLRVLHAGRPLDPRLGREAARRAQADPRYRWLGDQPRGRLRRRVAASQVLLHPSHMEGGALAIIEAITAGTPVIASRVDGNVGLLGADYPGLFAADDADAARALLLRAAREPRFLARLQRACRARARLFAPAREARTVIALVDNCLSAASATDRAGPRRSPPSRSKVSR
ncbi:MAG: TIGR04348 family glycosyltransferase [Burkholderiaceae bacterium]|jgi:putative glycosyltransferase (TIGR04348 family)|nr:TIGR04348 family glycosyltransferase [Burkholderiaceae bacterium]